MPRSKVIPVIELKIERKLVAIRPTAGQIRQAAILLGRGYSPRSGVDWVSRSAICPAAERTIEAVVIYAPQRDGQEKQLCYSPRSWASKVI